MCLVVRTAITHGQNVSRNRHMRNDSLHYQLASRAKFNRLSVKWPGGYFAYKVTAPWWAGSYSEGKQSLSKMLGSVHVEGWRGERGGPGQLARPQSKCWE